MQYLDNKGGSLVAYRKPHTNVYWTLHNRLAERHLLNWQTELDFGNTEFQMFERSRLVLSFSRFFLYIFSLHENKI